MGGQAVVAKAETATEEREETGTGELELELEPKSWGLRIPIYVLSLTFRPQSRSLSDKNQIYELFVSGSSSCFSTAAHHRDDTRRKIFILFDRGSDRHFSFADFFHSIFFFSAASYKIN